MRAVAAGGVSTKNRKIRMNNSIRWTSEKSPTFGVFCSRNILSLLGLAHNLISHPQFIIYHS
jgi:hypothetical protein